MIQTQRGGIIAVGPDDWSDLGSDPRSDERLSTSHPAMRSMGDGTKRSAGGLGSARTFFLGVMAATHSPAHGQRPLPLSTHVDECSLETSLEGPRWAHLSRSPVNAGIFQ